MTTSEWIAIASMLLPIFAGLAIMIFRTGGIVNELKNLSGRVKRLEKGVAKLNRAHDRP